MIDYQGNNFKLFLEKNKIGATKASKLLNVTRNQIYNYFKSEKLERETVDKILAVFKVKEIDVFGNKKNIELTENEDKTPKNELYEEIIRLLKKDNKKLEQENQLLREELDELKGKSKDLAV